MCKRSLSLVIAAALFGAGAVAAQTSTPQHLRSTEAPPPAAAASMHGQTHVPGQQPATLDERCMEQAGMDEDRYNDCIERERAQAALDGRDELYGAEVQHRSEAELRTDRQQVVHERRVDLDDERVAVEARTDLDGDFDEVRVGADTRHEMQVAREGTDQHTVAMADADVEVREGEFEPFAETAGTEGFSSGVTASAAEREFNRLGGGDALTRDQLAGTALANRFDEYDINNDGEIAENEFQSWFAANRDASQRGSVDTGYATSDERLDDDRRDDRAVAAGADDDFDVDVDVDYDDEDDRD
jgi:hypothetical protein